LLEETGVNVAVGRLRAVHENVFLQNHARHHELNLVFEGELVDVSFPACPVSLERHIEFLWQPVARLAEARFLPEALGAAVLDEEATSTGAAWLSALG
jgi:hypothetical protein